LGALSPVTLSDEDAMAVFRKRLRSGIETFVAIDQDRVIGTAALLLETKFIHNGGCVGHVEDVAVDPHYQGHGVGQALIRHLIEQCRQAKCYKVILDCNPQLTPWYGKLGFREWCTAMRLDLDVAMPQSPT
jgi:glucosamine-phosphate N-acetyltransferase